MTRHLSHLESIHSAGTFASTAALKAVAVSGLINNTWSYVESEGEYYYDSASFEAESLPDIIQPASGAGRWYKKKVTAVSPNNILKLLSGKVNLSGGILTGSLILASDPSSALQAATKQYVDNAVQTVSGSVSGLVSDAAFSSSWDGSLAVAPSRNALYDKIVTLFSNGGNAFGADAILGTTDNYNLSFKTNNVTALTLSNTQAATFANTVNMTTLALYDGSAYSTAFTAASNTLSSGGGFPTLNFSAASTIDLRFTMNIRAANTGTAGNNGIVLTKNGAAFYSSGTAAYVTINGTFSPASGSAVLNTLQIIPTINQTGGANGTVRGIYYNPTLTSIAGSHIAIETTAGKVVFGGSATSTTGTLDFHSINPSITLTGSTTSKVANALTIKPVMVSSDATDQLRSVLIQGNYSGVASGNNRKDPLDLYVAGRAAVGTSLSLGTTFTAFNQANRATPLMIQTNTIGGAFITNNFAQNVTGTGLGVAIAGDANLNTGASIVYSNSATSSYNVLTGAGYSLKVISGNNISSGAAGGIFVQSIISNSNITMGLLEAVRVHHYVQSNDQVVTVSNVKSYISGGQLVGNGAGTSAAITNLSDFVTENYYGISANSIVNRYALYLGHTKGSSASSWGIYQTDENTWNHFKGRLGVGVVPTSSSATLSINQTILGTEVVSIQSTATNDDPCVKIYQNRIATSDATPTVLHTFTIPANTTYKVSVVVIARRTGGTAGTAEDSASYVLDATYKNVGGTATLIGSRSLIAQEDQAAWDADLMVNGGNVELKVTGALNNNITWHMSKGEVYLVSI